MPRRWGERSPATNWRWFDPEPPRAKTLYVGLDGTGVPVRKAETAGRAGKQADGSAKTREVKLVTVWSAEGPRQARVAVPRSGLRVLQCRHREHRHPGHRPDAVTLCRAGAA